MTTQKKRSLFLVAAGLITVTAALAAYADHTLSGTATLTEEYMNRTPSSRHDGKRFNNPDGKGPNMHDWSTMLKRYAFGDEVRNPGNVIPQQIPDLEAFYAETEGIRVIWVSHSTVLLNVEGTIILTDPVFSRTVSPVPLMGPARFTAATPLAIDALPHVDVVLLSHDHYDHLDKDSIKQLLSKADRFVAPLGVDGHLLRWGVLSERIVVLDWWGSVTIHGLEFHAAPAQHFSGRGVLDRNTTLWASWAVLGSESRLFFGGDSGYHSGFKEIGERLGPFDLTLLECGAYSEHWPDVHMLPEQTAQAHRDLRGRVLLPIHWATFNLALHDWFEPVERLRAAGTELTISTPMQGQVMDPREELPVAPWWSPVMQAESNAPENNATSTHSSLQ